MPNQNPILITIVAYVEGFLIKLCHQQLYKRQRNLFWHRGSHCGRWLSTLFRCSWWRRVWWFRMPWWSRFHLCRELERNRTDRMNWARRRNWWKLAQREIQPWPPGWRWDAGWLGSFQGSWETWPSRCRHLACCTRPCTSHPCQGTWQGNTMVACLGFVYCLFTSSFPACPRTSCTKPSCFHRVIPRASWWWDIHVCTNWG